MLLPIEPSVSVDVPIDPVPGFVKLQETSGDTHTLSVTKDGGSVLARISVSRSAVTISGTCTSTGCPEPTVTYILAFCTNEEQSPVVGRAPFISVVTEQD